VADDFFRQKEAKRRKKEGLMTKEIDPRWMIKSRIGPLKLLNYAGWAGSLCPTSAGCVSAPDSSIITVGLPKELLPGEFSSSDGLEMNKEV